MVNRHQKSIKDSKLRKQFNQRAKQRKEWKAKKANGEITKYVDKKKLKQPAQITTTENADEPIKQDSISDSDIEMVPTTTEEVKAAIVVDQHPELTQVLSQLMISKLQLVKHPELYKALLNEAIKKTST